MLDWGSNREASPSRARRQFFIETLTSKLKGKTGTIIKRCLIKFACVSNITDIVLTTETHEN
jgi:hypothetical protein